MLLSETLIFTFQPARKNSPGRELKFVFFEASIRLWCKCYLVTVTKQKTVYVCEGEIWTTNIFLLEAYSQAVGNYDTSRGKSIVNVTILVYLCIVLIGV